MNKKQRAAKAARAAKRIPLVGTAVAVAPLIQAAGDSGLGLSNLTSMGAWKTFFSHIIRNYTGVDETGAINGTVLVKTWVPIGVYVLAQRTRISRPISKVLGHFGLRF